jgi:hypothetical protein
MKEPKKIKLNPDTPSNKDVDRVPMPPVNKPEWDITGHSNDDVYTPIDLDNINKLLDKVSNENSQNSN